MVSGGSSEGEQQHHSVPLFDPAKHGAASASAASSSLDATVLSDVCYGLLRRDTVHRSKGLCYGLRVIQLRKALGEPFPDALPEARGLRVVLSRPPEWDHLDERTNAGLARESHNTGSSIGSTSNNSSSSSSEKSGSGASGSSDDDENKRRDQQQQQQQQQQIDRSVKEQRQRGVADAWFGMSRAALGMKPRDSTSASASTSANMTDEERRKQQQAFERNRQRQEELLARAHRAALRTVAMVQRVGDGDSWARASGSVQRAVLRTVVSVERAAERTAERLPSVLARTVTSLREIVGVDQPRRA